MLFGTSLGLGAQPPTPEWGKMVGDGLRDALDPRVGRVAVE